MTPPENSSSPRRDTPRLPTFATVRNSLSKAKSVRGRRGQGRAGAANLRMTTIRPDTQAARPEPLDNGGHDAADGELGGELRGRDIMPRSDGASPVRGPDAFKGGPEAPDASVGSAPTGSPPRPSPATTSGRSSFDPALSAKLKIVSLVSIFLVLLSHVHPPNPGLENVVMTMTRPNRVLFFGVAGFLFTFGFPFHKERLFQKWGDRARTLLVPYLLTIIVGKVAVIAYLFVAPKDWLRKSKGLADIWNSGDLRWAGLVWSEEAIHLWFLEGLMLAIVLYGAVLVSTRWNRAVHFASVTASLACLNVFPSAYFQALLFFGVGTLFARRASLLTSAGPGPAWTGALGVVWVGCMWVYLTIDKATTSSVARETLFLVHSCIGAVFLWLAVDRIPNVLRKVLGPFCSYVFPIYLIHLGVLTLMRRLVGSLFWGSLVWDLTGLIVVALLTAYGSFLLARSIEIVLPSAAAIWFGGRGAAKTKGCRPHRQVREA